jgi:hypothetical protein
MAKRVARGSHSSPIHLQVRREGSQHSLKQCHLKCYFIQSLDLYEEIEVLKSKKENGKNSTKTLK